MLMRN
jgi:SAM-dependent methyltransferase